MTADPQLFEVAAGDEDDWDLPIDIVHRRDLAEPNAAGGFDVDHNFLDYTFQINDRLVSARTYLDAIGVVYVNLSRAELAAPELAPCLRYLQRRFEALSCIEDGRTVLGWVRADAA